MQQTETATRIASQDWEQEIRTLEDQARIAFLESDIEFLDQLWTDSFTVNSPLDRINRKAEVLELLETGKIRHTSYECEIEHISRHGDVVVVMGNDRVDGPPEGVIARRRYTNVWQLENGAWRSIARHAHVVSREGARST